MYSSAVCLLKNHLFVYIAQLFVYNTQLLLFIYFLSQLFVYIIQLVMKAYLAPSSDILMHN